MATILIVDDRALNRRFLTTLLGYAGHETIEAEDGIIALTMAQVRRPDLMITDVLMPNMDGVMLTEMLRTTAGLEHVPVIFYTATYRLEDAHEMASTLGVQRILSKPCEPQAILDTVTEVLREAGIAPPTPPSSVSAELANAMQSPGDIGPLQDSLREVTERGLAMTEQHASAEKLKLAFTDIQTLSLRMSALLELSLELGSEHNPAGLIELCCRATQDILGTRQTMITIAEEGKPLRQATRGLDEWECAHFAEMNWESPPPAFAEARASGKAVLIRGNARAQLGALAEHSTIRSAMLVPLRTSGSDSGWIYVADKLGGAFDHNDEQFGSALAAAFANAYDNLDLLEQVRQDAESLRREISERAKAERARRESDKRFFDLFRAHPLPMWVQDGETAQFKAVNAAAVAHYGYSEAEFLVMTVEDLQAPSPATLPRRFWPHGVDESDVWQHCKKDGGLIDVEISSHTLSFDGSDCRFVVAQDITARLQTEERNARLSRISAVLSDINSAIVRIRDRHSLLQEACRVAVDSGTFRAAWIGEIGPNSLDGVVVAWHGAVESYIDSIRLTAQLNTPYSSRPANVALRENRAVVFNDIGESSLPDVLKEEYRSHGFRAVAAFPLVTEGRSTAVLTLFADQAGFFDDEELELLMRLAGDVSFGLQFIERERQLRYLALYDSLTDLPNRRLLLERLTQFIHAAEHQQLVVAVFAVDLDHFRQINDAFGRHVGDELLRQVSARWDAALIEPYCLARLDSDSFAIAVGDLPGHADGTTIVRDRLELPLAEPLDIGGHALRIGFRTGIALYPDDGNSAEQLLNNAESAMKQALLSGERHFYFDPATQARMAEKLALENDLRQAVEAQQFVLYFQPRVDLARGRIVGAEALIRWHHPEKGLVPPAQFIPLAEETGLILPIGDWVIRTVCQQVAQWQRTERHVVPISLNLSAAQFKGGRVLDTLHQAIAQHAVKAKLIELELTESLLMHDPQAAISILSAFRSMGVRLSLDDFGTGYSSLAYLSRFPFDFLKIDRAFVAGVPDNVEDGAIAKVIIALAKQLNLRTVAEGVETEEQLSFLHHLGCDEMQGYLFSKPVPVEQFEQMLREHVRLSLPTYPAGKHSPQRGRSTFST
ncbi:EAL domain-containing protein [Dyella choica]|uniref:cyclic-guanylate-specific phosphodiesterase n=1 Tax=Dyella choica TaxID=1927959 RepID=A0A3S0R0R2_9GAMM|nr:EAL domain-containing protein [Dyella choica]RUL70128.1 EAL domain-containing protein [Dyella choica]